jgi:hypothetical protein
MLPVAVPARSMVWPMGPRRHGVRWCDALMDGQPEVRACVHAACQTARGRSLGGLTTSVSVMALPVRQDLHDRVAVRRSLVA